MATAHLVCIMSDQDMPLIPHKLPVVCAVVCSTVKPHLQEGRQLLPEGALQQQLLHTKVPYVLRILPSCKVRLQEQRSRQVPPMRRLCMPALTHLSRHCQSQPGKGCFSQPFRAIALLWLDLWSREMQARWAGGCRVQLRLLAGDQLRFLCSLRRRHCHGHCQEAQCCSAHSKAFPLVQGHLQFTAYYSA